MTFESSYENYMVNNYTMIDWIPKDPRKIWHLIYRVPEDKVGEVVSLSAKNHAGHIHITAADFPNPYNTLPSESYMDKILNAIPGGDPLIEPSFPFQNGGRSALTPASTIAGADYTSISMEWTYPEADPYGFAIYSNGDELARVPGFMRRVTIGNLHDGMNAMSMTVKAIGTDGKEGPPSPASVGGTKSFSVAAVRNVKISGTSEQTTIEAEISLPYGFIRIYFTDHDSNKLQDFAAWPIRYNPNGARTANYMVEGRTLFKYNGRNETDALGNRDWSWIEVSKRDNCEVIRDKTIYKWNIPMAATNNIDPNYIIVQTEGYNPTTNTFLPCPRNMVDTVSVPNIFCSGDPPISEPPSSPPSDPSTPLKPYYDCKGGKLCDNTLDFIKHCDIAVNSLVHQTGEKHMYTADKPLGESGMCSINPITGQGCKVYVQGKGCSLSGDDMWAAYQDLKDVKISGCKKCGTKHFGDGCMLTRDYHFDLGGNGCSGSAARSRFLIETGNSTAAMNYTAQMNETSSMGSD
jgi:hypothetical protein